MIGSNTTVNIIDTKTGIIVSTSTYGKIKSIRAKVERLNQAYGCVRYAYTVVA